MAPKDSNEHDHHDHKYEHVEWGELKEYIKHNIAHLEEHIVLFQKLQKRIEDKHALESLKNAINYLQKGLDELNHFFQHI